MRGWCEQPGFRRIGLGECRGTILSAAGAEAASL
jgi:fumarylacetoacetase